MIFWERVDEHEVSLKSASNVFNLTDRTKYHHVLKCDTQKEIDCIENENGRISAFKFKWHEEANCKLPMRFLDIYPDGLFRVVSPDYVEDFLLQIHFDF